MSEGSEKKPTSLIGLLISFFAADGWKVIPVKNAGQLRGAGLNLDEGGFVGGTLKRGKKRSAPNSGGKKQKSR